MSKVRSNQGRTCTVNGRALASMVEQVDLGMKVHIFLKVVAQVDRLVKEACVKGN